MDADRRLIEDIRSTLAANGDADRAAAQQAYMKSELPFHGISSPELARLLRPIFTAHRIEDRDRWQTTVIELWQGATHREQRYAAIQLTGHRFYRSWQDPDTLDLYRELVITGAWWDYVDDLAANRVGPILADHRPAITPVIICWSTDDDLWLRRTAILAQLKHKSDTDLALLEQVIRANLIGSPHGGDFFIRKAIGWALRQYARTDPGWVIHLVDSLREQLSPLSRREATKHLQ